jgi:pSer/pThr/pTyr-binding forkhead associated (FHA) protein
MCFVMPRRFTVGREKGCDIAIADDSVSRLHAEVWMADDGAIMMADRGSSNGTTLLRGGRSFPLGQDVLLPGDQVRFGGVLLSVADIVLAIESRNPGALSPRGAASGVYSPPGKAPPPPPPPRIAPPPPPPPPAHGAGAAFSTGVLIRCDCGAIKTQGQVCPGCHR